MKKVSFFILGLLSLTSCTTGTRDVEVKHWAYVHQVLDQSDTKKVALANVGYLGPQGEKWGVVYSVKLILENCKYENEWVDGQYYVWSGILENTRKSFSFTTATSAQRTVPVYYGNCAKKDIQKQECFSWERDCIVERKED